LRLRVHRCAFMGIQVRAPNGKVIAAVSISGPIERLGRQPGRIHAAAVVATAARLTEYLTRE
jgi:DNA-binding IclR family transcriptional regulator